jgi:hypothetical protein
VQLPDFARVRPLTPNPPTPNPHPTDQNNNKKTGIPKKKFLKKFRKKCKSLFLDALIPELYKFPQSKQ